MKKENSWVDIIRYKFDNTLSKGSIALIGWLGLISLVIIVIAGVFISVTHISQPGQEPLGFAEAAWESLMRTLDAGTMGGDEGWSYRIVMMLVTIGGIFVISTLIGVLTSTLEQKIEELQKGRSRVIEKNHTVILGWSEQIYSILTELIEANSNQKDACIVILGEKDKMEMQDLIRDRVPDTKTTRIVCRSGSPIEMADLTITSLNAARSIIVLSPEVDNPDAEMIKTILAITNNPDRKTEKYHIVAELREPRNLEVAELVGRDEVEFIQVSSLIARIIAQTCRQSGLSTVYTELLDFGGDEIYFHKEPALTGHTFREALGAFSDSAVIGIFSTSGQSLLNPAMDTVLGEQDQLILIAEDDDKIGYTPDRSHQSDPSILADRIPRKPQPEKTLVLGWNWRGTAILQELDRYVPAGSKTLVVAIGDGLAEAVSELGTQLQNQTVQFQTGDTTDRRTLNQLEIQTFDHIVLLCYSDTLSQQQADAHTLVTLLHLRDMAEKANQNFSIVSEMLDIRNRNLAEVTRADDFIVSDKLISLMLAQVSENKALNAVFTDIFDPEGSEIYLKPAKDYVKLNTELDFYSVIESAARFGEVAIGYKLEKFSGEADHSYGVVVNPSKADKITFTEDDLVVVVAED
jgi:ion channel POLLUX/CASTOR